MLSERVGEYLKQNKITISENFDFHNRAIKCRVFECWTNYNSYSILCLQISIYTHTIVFGFKCNGHELNPSPLLQSELLFARD